VQVHPTWRLGCERDKTCNCAKEFGKTTKWRLMVPGNRGDEVSRQLPQVEI